MLARDPDDVAPVLAKPLARKPLHTMESRDGIPATMPRWMADGRSILCVRFEPDPQGFLHPDRFRWTPKTGDFERLTWQADLRDPDPSPLTADPDWAVAVRKRDGTSAVVRIDLKTGQETALANMDIGSGDEAASQQLARAMTPHVLQLLKPGGVLGIEDHRLPESMDTGLERSSGYLKVSTVRRLAEQAGFKFAGASEVNANPKDTHNYAKGVWTLPPVYAEGETDRAKYAAIGESDRMTLKFVKPR